MMGEFRADPSINPVAHLSEHEVDTLALARQRREQTTVEELLARGAMRTQRPKFVLRMSRAGTLEKLGIPPWRITATGQRLEERSDEYVAERWELATR